MYTYGVVQKSYLGKILYITEQPVFKLSLNFRSNTKGTTKNESKFYPMILSGQEFQSTSTFSTSSKLTLVFS